MAVLVALVAVTVVTGDADASTVGQLATEIDELDEQVANAERRAEAAEDELERLASDLVDARDQLVAVQGRLDDAEARLRMLEGQLALAEREQEALEAAAVAAAGRAEEAADELAAVERELAAEEQRLDDQMALSFMHGTTARPVMVMQLLEEIEQPENLAADMYTVGVVLDTQATLIDEVDQLRLESVEAADAARAARIAADEAAAEAAEAVEISTALRDDQAVTRAALEEDRREQAVLLASLEADADEQEAVLASVSAELDRLGTERAAAVAAAAAAAAAEETASSSGGGGGSSVGGGGPCPVDGAVAGRDFSNDWGHPRPGGRSHEGTDVFATRGTPVRAVANGTVKDVRYTDSGLGGRVVSIWVAPGEHWYYAHLDSVAGGLSEGSPVVAGQLLGTVGDSGNARGTPPHLHIGNYVDGSARNPYPVLAERCR